MNLHDEQLQKKIESGEVDPGNPDAEAYQKVFSALNKEPEMKLSADFSDKVIDRLLAAKRNRSSTDFIWFGLGVMILLAGFGYTISLVSQHMEFDINLEFLSAFTRMKWFFIIGALLVTVFNWLEKRLLSHR